MTETFTTWADICTDCLFTLEGVHDDPTSVTPTPMARLNDDPSILLINPPMTDDSHFSRWQCEGCGSLLAGTRHTVGLLVVAA